MKRTGNSEKRNEAESVGYIGNSETNRKLEESGMVHWKGCCVHVARNSTSLLRPEPSRDSGQSRGRREASESERIRGGGRNAPECGGGGAEAQEQMGESAREVGLHGGCRAEEMRAVHRWTGKLAKDGSGVLPPFELDGAMAEEMGCERDPRLQESRIVQIPGREVDGQRCTKVQTDCAEARTGCAEARTGRAGNA